jgi:hypothetical protein
MEKGMWEILKNKSEVRMKKKKQSTMLIATGKLIFYNRIFYRCKSCISFSTNIADRHIERIISSTRVMFVI